MMPVINSIPTLRSHTPTEASVGSEAKALAMWIAEARQSRSEQPKPLS